MCLSFVNVLSAFSVYEEQVQLIEEQTIHTTMQPRELPTEYFMVLIFDCPEQKSVCTIVSMVIRMQRAK